MKKPVKTNTYDCKSSFLQLGGDVVLDFCNTLVVHGTSQEDRLVTAMDAQHFWRGFFSVETPIEQQHFEELVKLRSELRAAFKCIIQGDFGGDCFKQINQILRTHTFNFKLIVTRDASGGLTSLVEPTRADVVAPFIVELHRFVNELDTSRLKKCSNPNCSHLFYDRSKNNLRSWCSMKTCGNIMKARAFHQRKLKAKIRS